MANWTLISVVMSVVQPALAFLTLSTRGAVPSLSDLIGRGELLTSTSGLSVYAASALFISSASALKKLESGGPAICILLIATYYQAYIAAAVRSAIEIDYSMVVGVSLILHGAAIAIGTRCTWLSEKQ